MAQSHPKEPWGFQRLSSGGGKGCFGTDPRAKWTGQKVPKDASKKVNGFGNFGKGCGQEKHGGMVGPFLFPNCCLFVANEGPISSKPRMFLKTFLRNIGYSSTP